MQEGWLEIGGLFVSAFVSATVAPGGSEAVLAYLIAEERHPALALVAIATLGNTLGAMTTWGLGMLAAKRYPAAALLPEKSQKALDVVTQRGIWALFFSWLPVIGDALCFAGGWLKLPLLTGTLVILLGKLGRYAAVAWAFG
jgi:membrane protein YqaA with SNARE-associated domain